MLTRFRHSRLFKLIAARLVLVLLLNTCLQQASYAYPPTDLSSHNLSINTPLGDELTPKDNPYIPPDLGPGEVTDLGNAVMQVRSSIRLLRKNIPDPLEQEDAVHALVALSYKRFNPAVKISAEQARSTLMGMTFASALDKAEIIRICITQATNPIMMAKKGLPPEQPAKKPGGLTKSPVTPQNAAELLRTSDFFDYSRIPEGQEAEVMALLLTELADELSKDVDELFAYDLWEMAFEVRTPSRAPKNRSLERMVAFVKQRFLSEERHILFSTLAALDIIEGLTHIPLWRGENWQAIAEIFGVTPEKFSQKTVLDLVVRRSLRPEDATRFHIKDVYHITTKDEETALSEQVRRGNKAAYITLCYLFSNYIAEWATEAEIESATEGGLGLRRLESEALRNRGTAVLETAALRYDAGQGPFGTYLLRGLQRARKRAEDEAQRSITHEIAAARTRGIFTPPAEPIEGPEAAELVGKARQALSAIFDAARTETYRYAYQRAIEAGKTPGQACASANYAVRSAGASVANEHILLERHFGAESPVERKSYKEIGDEGIPIVEQTGADGALEPGWPEPKPMKAISISNRAASARPVLNAYLSPRFGRIEVEELSQAELITMLAHLWDTELSTLADETGEGDEPSIGVTQSETGIMPHRGYSPEGTVNYEIVKTLAECIENETLFESCQGRLDEEDVRAFINWFNSEQKNEGDDTPGWAKIGIDKLADPDIEIPAFNGNYATRTNLRVVKLPVEELGRVNGEPFYGHVSLREGIIWVAAGRDEAEVAVTILHEAQEYITRQQPLPKG